MLTFALGIDAPEGSVTVPAMPPKTACPDDLVTAAIETKSSTLKANFLPLFIRSLLTIDGVDERLSRFRRRLRAHNLSIIPSDTDPCTCVRRHTPPRPCLTKLYGLC